MIRIVQAILVLLAMSDCAAVHSATPIPPAPDCSIPTADMKALIAGCSRAINSGTLDKSALATAHFFRSFGYAHLSQPERMRGDCDAIVALEPDDSLGYDCRGDMSGAAEKYDAAIANFSRALQLNPRDGLALLGRGDALQLKGDFAGSIPDFDATLKLNPPSSEALNNRCWSRGVIGKELDAALSDCNEAIRLGPSANRYNTRAFVRFRLKHYVEAIRDDDAAVNLDGKDGSSFYIRGLAKRALGDSAGGRADIAKAISLDPAITQRYRSYGISPIGN